MIWSIEIPLAVLLFRIIMVSILSLTSFTALAQKIDSVALDLEKLPDSAFFKKYSFFEGETTAQDLEVTRMVWSLDQTRNTHHALKSKDVPTLTRIDDRPGKGKPYYLVGHYQLPTAGHWVRMSFYRVDLVRKTIDYQDLDDFVKDHWKRVR